MIHYPVTKLFCFKHSDKVGYQGAKITAKALSDCITEDRENKVIVDIAAGTGLVADEVLLF